jgi:hypothetical protein
MAVAHGLDRFPPARPHRGLGRAFALGTSPGPLHAIAETLVTFWDLLRPERSEDRPPLVLAITRILLWIVAGVVLTSAAGVAVGALAVRLYSGVAG